MNNQIEIEASADAEPRHEGSPQTSTGHPQRWNILWILCGSLVLVVVSVSSLNVAIPAIQQSLGASSTELQWIIDSYALVFAGVLLPAGALGDRLGRRGALITGLLIFSVAAAGGMLADSPLQLIVWRAVMGAGAAFIMPATLSIVSSVFGPDERAKAIAIWAGFAGAGGVVGLLSSGVLLERFWWGSIFAVNLPIALVLLAAVLWLVPTSKDPEATPFDPVGAVLSIVGLSGLVFGVIEGAEKGWLSGEALGGFVAAVVGLGGFVLWELRTDHPLLDPRFFRHRDFSMGSFAITVTFFGIFGMFFVITQFFQFVQGHDALATGLRITPYAVVLLVAAPLAANAVERFGARLVTIVGAVFAGAGFLVLAQLGPDSSYPSVVVGLVAVSVGTGLLMPPATTALVASLPPAKAGVGSAMNDVTREVGGALGIAVVGALLSIGYENTVEDDLEALPADAAEVGADSFGGLLSVTRDLEPAAADELLQVGRQAFVDGQQLGMTVAGVLMFAVAAVFFAVRANREPQFNQLSEGVTA